MSLRTAATTTTTRLGSSSRNNHIITATATTTTRISTRAVAGAFRPLATTAALSVDGSSIIGGACVSNTNNNSFLLCHRRTFGTGARGARGLGWYQKYRDGRGGRHLQGRQHDWESRDVLEQLNNSVFNFGSSWHYIKLQVEQSANMDEKEKDEEEEVETTNNNESDDVDRDDAGKDDTTPAADTSNATPAADSTPGSIIYELRLELATAAMPLTTQNFQLLAPQYVDTIVHRIEKKVGLCLGDVRNTLGKSGYCHPSLSPTGKLLETEPLVLSHLEGIVTMISPGVDKVDSRFLLCTHDAHHLDGRFVPFGRLSPESLEICKELERTQMTKLGLPNLEIKIIECGPVLDIDGGSEENEEQAA